MSLVHCSTSLAFDCLLVEYCLSRFWTVHMEFKTANAAQGLHKAVTVTGEHCCALCKMIHNIAKQSPPVGWRATSFWRPPDIHSFCDSQTKRFTPFEHWFFWYFFIYFYACLSSVSRLLCVKKATSYMVGNFRSEVGPKFQSLAWESEKLQPVNVFVRK